MDETDLRTLLPPARTLTIGQRQQILRHVLVDGGGRREVKGRLSRRARRLTGTFLALALSAGAATATAAVLRHDQPDRHQAERVEAAMRPERSGHTLGWRQELDAEQVECGRYDAAAGRLGATIRTYASEFPLAERLTQDRLVQECRSGNDAVGGNGDAVACTVSGGPEVPLVVLGASSCASAGAAYRALDQKDLDELDRRRALEVAILDVPTGGACPSYIEARRWASRQIAASGSGLRLRAGGDEGPGCYRGITYWEPMVVWVQPVGPQGG